MGGCSSKEALKEHMGRVGVGKHYAWCGFTPGRPVLIVPGFMSSALEIEHSEIQPSWQGERAWIDLAKLGVERLKHRGKCSATEPAKPPSPSDTQGDDDEEADDDEEYALKNKWIRHMLLAGDHWGDPPGVRVRPVKGSYGLDAVQYLAKGITSDPTWVFARVVKVLEEVGYQAGVDLRAVPYDWRIPPGRLEERDGYFTHFKVQVEELVASSGGRPVVLLAHSMGCKIVHYFLTWMIHVQRAEADPKAWVQAHIYSFLPVGGPFLGAPVSVRSTISGDYMGLEAFLNYQESLVFGRNIGSPPFLYPTASSLSGSSLGAHFFVRDAGRLKVHLLGMEGDVSRAIAKGHLFYVSVKVGKEGLRTRRLHPKVANWADTVNPHLFQFPLPIDGNELQVKIMFGMSSGLPTTMKGLWTSSLTKDTATMLSDLGLKPNVPTAIRIPLYGKSPEGKPLKEPFVLAVELTHEPCTTDCKVLVSRLKESLQLSGFPEQAALDETPDRANTGHCVWPVVLGHAERSAGQSRLEKVNIVHKKHPALTYSARTTEEMMMVDDLNLVYCNWQRNYRSDPVHGLEGRSEDAPYIPRVYHIYGVNCDTEVGAVYKHRPYRVKAGVLNSCIQLDGSARVAGSKGGYTVKGGLIMETKRTVQRLNDAGTEVEASGDGTVPYASLRHVVTWRNAGVDVKCEEIEGCLHREILGDNRMHKLLLDYVCQPPVMRIVISGMNISFPDPGKILPKESKDLKKVQFLLEANLKGEKFKTGSLSVAPYVSLGESSFVFGLSQDEVASGGIYVTISLKRSTYLNKAMSMMGIKKVMKAVGMEESSEAFATAVFSPMQLLANNSYDANRHGAWRVALCDHGGAATSNSIQFVIQSFSGWEESNGKPPAPLPPPPAVCYV